MRLVKAEDQQYDAKGKKDQASNVVHDANSLAGNSVSVGPLPHREGTDDGSIQDLTPIELD